MSELGKKIERADTLEEMNNLRDELVSKMLKGSKEASKLIKKWQDKYWDMKQCEECGTNYYEDELEPSHPLKS